MKRRRASIFASVVLLSRLGLAQGSAALAGVTKGNALASPAVLAFRHGLEISVDTGPWATTRAIALPKARCAPSVNSPCAPGTAPLIVNIRFPALANPIDGSKVLAQLGESGSAVNRYFVRPVPANAKGPVCGGGFAVPTPSPTMRIAINLGNPGTPLPVTCRWTVLVGAPDPSSPIGFDMVWSDTVVVKVTGKP